MLNIKPRDPSWESVDGYYGYWCNELKKEGHTLADISHILNIDRTMAYNYTTEKTIKPHNYYATIQDAEDVQEMRKNGCTLEEIANKYNMTKCWAWYKNEYGNRFAEAKTTTGNNFVIMNMETLDYIKQLYASGRSINSISRLTGYCYSAIRKRLVNAGLIKAEKRHRYTKEEIEYLKNCYNESLTPKQAIQETGFNYFTVYKYYKKWREECKQN